MHTPDTLPVSSEDKVLFLGDSITDAAGIGREWTSRPFDGDGWLSILSRRAPDGMQMVNRGVSGNRVPDLLARLEDDVLAAAPTVVVVYIGINDVWHTTSGNGTPGPQYRTGLREVVDRIAATGARVLLCTPTVIGEKVPGSNDLDALLQDFTTISRETAAAAGVPLCDLSAAFHDYLADHNADDRDAGILTTDGVHLTASGNALVAQTIGDALGLP